MTWLTDTVLIDKIEAERALFLFLGKLDAELNGVFAGCYSVAVGLSGARGSRECQFNPEGSSTCILYVNEALMCRVASERIGRISSGSVL